MFSFVIGPASDDDDDDDDDGAGALARGS